MAELCAAEQAPRHLRRQRAARRHPRADRRLRRPARVRARGLRAVLARRARSTRSPSCSASARAPSITSASRARSAATAISSCAAPPPQRRPRQPRRRLRLPRRLLAAALPSARSRSSAAWSSPPPPPSLSASSAPGPACPTATTSAPAATRRAAAAGRMPTSLPSRRKFGVGGGHLLGLLLGAADRARPLLLADRHGDDEALVVVGAELLDDPVGRRGLEARLRRLLQARLEVVEVLDLDGVDAVGQQPLDEIQAAWKPPSR